MAVWCDDCKSLVCKMVVGMKTGFIYINGVKINYGMHSRAAETAQEAAAGPDEQMDAGEPETAAAGKR